MSKCVFKMSKTYSDSGFIGVVVDILNIVLNKKRPYTHYTKSIFFTLLILTNSFLPFWKITKLSDICIILTLNFPLIILPFPKMEICIIFS